MDRDNQNTLNTTSEQASNISKVTHDPGWNDPPKLSYDGSMSQTKFIKKGLLNKRVAFPLNSNSSTPPTSSPLATPPKGNALLPFSAGDGPSDGANSSTPSPFTSPSASYLSPKSNETPPTHQQGEDQESSVVEVMTCFEQVISNLVTPENVDKIEDDIRKRLEIMKKMWTEEKLSNTVKQKMMKLAEALQKGEGSLANEIHIGIIVDHTNEVSPWMPGVRKLVHYSLLAMKNSQEESANETGLSGMECSPQTIDKEETCL